MAHLGIDPETWSVLSRLLDEALDLPLEQRARWLDGLSVQYASLKPRLADLLARVPSADGGGLFPTFPRLGSGHAGSLPAMPEEKPGDAVGLYRLVRRLGDGGMGTVWLAERTDGLIDRPVALKLPRGTWQRPELAARMARERRILATLNHPNIARLYDAGLTEEGVPFLALEYVEGERIDHHCHEHRLDPAARVRLFLQVARAVAHAHARLVVHRDLKPSNILVTAEGEVRLLDFGVAGLLAVGDGRAQVSELTQLVGPALTPVYASPEQIQGAPLGVASDVYSLGVVLCEVLTGRRPYGIKRETRRTLEDAILRGEPERPSSLAESAAVRAALRGDLDTIVLKTLKKNPDERYGSVQALADDLERYLGGFPVLARPDSRVYRARRFVRRHRAGVFAAAAVVCAVLAGAGSAIWQAYVARVEQRRAEEVKHFIVSVFADADPFRGEGGPITAGQLLVQARARVESETVAWPGLKAELLNLIGTGLVGLGDTEAAEQTVADAVRAATAEFGPAHPSTIEARLLATDVHLQRGQIDDMRRELDGILPLVLPRASEHPELLVRTLANVAHLEIEDGNAEEANAAAREALDVAQRALGPGHPRTIGSALVLAESYLHGGTPPTPETLADVDAALEVVFAAYRDRPNQPNVIHAREIRGRALAVAGHFRQAVAELEQALANAKAAFGPRSIVAGYRATSVAPYHRRLGDLKTALERSDQAIDLLAVHLRGGSNLRAFNLTSRGVTLVAARRPEAAERDLAEAERIYTEAFGADHWDTLTARFNRAIALAYLGRGAEAEAALRPLRDNPGVIGNRMWALHVAGVVARLRGDFSAAIDAQTQSLELIVAGPRAPWDRVRNLAERGLAALAAGLREAAGADLAEARGLFEALGTSMHPAQAEVLVGLARLAIDGGDTSAARPLLEEAARFWQGFEPGSAGAAEVSGWLEHCPVGRR